jgi:hypothetical protein
MSQKNRAVEATPDAPKVGTRGIPSWLGDYDDGYNWGAPSYFEGEDGNIYVMTLRDPRTP